MRHFNTEGVCRPEEHYMVRLDDRLAWIKAELVDKRKYFVVNRGRQYGKTTTLNALERYLKEEYIVLALDFQLMGSPWQGQTAGKICGSLWRSLRIRR